MRNIMVFFIILVTLIAFAIKAVNTVVDNNQKNEIAALEAEISELRKIKDDRILLQAEIYRLRKENINLMKKI